MTNKDLTHLAKSLRKKQSDAENNLWSRLRNAQLNGVKFRRQQPIGNYVVDLISFEKRLIIEVDGGQHNEPATINDDKERTTYLESQDYQVIRFWNNDVLLNIDRVADTIIEVLTPSP